MTILKLSKGINLLDTGLIDCKYRRKVFLLFLAHYVKAQWH